MFEGIRWYGHAAFKIVTAKALVVVDPYQIKDKDRADVILITHSHYDHLSEEDVDKVRSAETVCVAPQDCVERLGPQARVIEPGQALTLENGLKIEAVPAYNIDKQFHPKENGWLGYIIDDGERRIYIAGDTDHIEEMKDVVCDIAFLPVGGTYTMNADEAAAAVKSMQTDMAVPIHWGSIVGARADAERFVGQCGEKGRIIEAQP